MPEILSRGKRGSFSVSWSTTPSDWCSDLHFRFRLNSDTLTNGCLFNTFRVWLCVNVCESELENVYYECTCWKRKDRDSLLLEK